MKHANGIRFLFSHSVRTRSLKSENPAMEKVLEYHQEPELFKKISVNLKDLHLNPSVESVEKWLKDRSKELNDKAKKLL